MKFKKVYLISIFIYSFYTLTAQKRIVKNEFELNKIKSENLVKRDSISILYKDYYLKLKIDSVNEKANNEFLLRINELDVFSEKINNNEIEAEFSFINNNLSSQISPSLLLYRLKRREGLKLYDTIFNLYKKIDPKVQYSSDGILLFESLMDYRNSGVGSIAPDFIMKDVNNNEIILSSFRKKKYILLDFWASWCLPCVEDLPFLKNLYNKYNNKGFEIISISRDEDTDSLKNSIMRNEINIWQNISISENKSQIEKLFFITAIPVKILIDRDGMIIGRWRGGGEENKKELNYLLHKTFNE